jgi:hypothetical protein
MFIIGWIQHNENMNFFLFKPIWNEMNWILLNSTKFNSIEISLKTLFTMLNPKEINIVFNSFHFNLGIWIQMKINFI